MSVISQSIKNLLNGVSQRPPEQRESSQAVEQINGLSHPSRGVMKRPGTTHVAQLDDDPTGWDRAFLHVIDRDTNERYYLVITEGNVQVFDAFTGAPVPIEMPLGLPDYFNIPAETVTADFTKTDINYGAGGFAGFNYGEVPMVEQYSHLGTFAGQEPYRFGVGDWQFIKVSGHEALIRQDTVFAGGATDGLGTSPSTHAYFADYPIPSPQQFVEARVGGPSGWPLSAWLFLRGSDLTHTSTHYVLATDVFSNAGVPSVRFEFGYSAQSNAHTDLSGATEVIMTLAEVDALRERNALGSWWTLKFQAITLNTGSVLLRGYLNGNKILEYVHPTSDVVAPPLTNAGYAGFFLSGAGYNDTIHPENPTTGLPAAGARLDDFSIGAFVTQDEASPLGLGTGFKACTIGDVTIIANTLQKVQKKTDALADPVNEALIYVRQADFSTTYEIMITPNLLTIPATVTFTTPDGNTAAERALITSDYIAEQLRLLLVANATLTGWDFAFTRIGSTIYMKRDDNSDFIVRATDGMTDSGILAIKGKVQRFEDLPLRAIDGVIVEVTGDPGSEFDNYYVVYDDDFAAGNAGVWRECPKPGEEYKLDPATMPWAIVRKPAGGFALLQLDWRDREVGSLVTNPFPSFVGNRISEVFFHEGRLGFCSGENIILSGAADLFNFFRKSAKALYDSDFIDIKGAFQKATTWHTALHFDNKLLVWSDNAQVSIEGEPLSPKTVGLRQRTAYENNRGSPPRTVGERAFFPQIINGRTRVSEYFVPQFTGQLTALDTTRDIPKYIDGVPVWMAGSSTPGLVVVSASGDRSVLYVHSFLWAADTKVQSSWSKWTLPAGSTVSALDVVNGKLALIVVRADGAYLETLDLGAFDGVGDDPILLDRLVDGLDCSPGFAAGETTWTLPFEQTGVQVRRRDTGALIATTQPDAVTVTTTGAAGDLTALDVVIGVPFQFRYEPTRIYPRKQREGREVADTNGRLRLSYLTVFSEGGADFTVSITPQGRSAYTYTNAAGLTQFRVPVQTRNDEASIVITHDDPTPCCLTALEWEGKFSARSRGI
jgi:hypothetical protein